MHRSCIFVYSAFFDFLSQVDGASTRAREYVLRAAGTFILQEMARELDLVGADVSDFKAGVFV